MAFNQMKGYLDLHGDIVMKRGSPKVPGTKSVAVCPGEALGRFESPYHKFGTWLLSKIMTALAARLGVFSSSAVSPQGTVALATSIYQFFEAMLKLIRRFLVMAKLK